MKAETLSLLVAGLSVVVLPSTALPASEPVQLFDLRHVTLHDGPFLHSAQLNREQLLRHDPDRLLAPYLSAAGLEPKATPYPNWESTGLGGHTAGHYLSALANTAALLRDEQCRERLDYIVAELARCQQANGDAYVGGAPGGREIWRRVRAGDIQAQSFSLNGGWVPLYNLHKTFAGLRDAYLIGGNEQARDVLVELAEWCDRLVADLTDEQLQAMLASEHGGMNEVLADVAAMTGDSKYLRLAERFSHRVLLDPLANRQDRLDGMHANTQVPKVIGFQRIASLGGPDKYHDAAEFFWRTLVEERSIAIGGNSVSEHFPSARRSIDFVTSREGPETCNTYNMLRLTEQLFAESPDAKFADFYERALYNHILSTQHPAHGGYVYFTPARPQHYRVYSQAEQCFWCCVGSGMENHSRHGTFIYAHDDDSLYVNLFIASSVDWEAKGLRLTQKTAFPDTQQTRLTLNLRSPTRLALRLRRPAWAGEGYQVLVNGESAAIDAGPSSYVTVEREWKNGDEVEIKLPMAPRIEPLPHLDDYVAINYGPLVLAAVTGRDGLDGLVAGDGRMDHVAHGPLRPLDEAPMLIGEEDELPGLVKPTGSKPLEFSIADAVRPSRYDSLRLIPFFRVHDARYMLYWRSVAPEEYDDILAESRAAEAARVALDRATVDRVVPGEQQPEVEHNFQGERTSSGVWMDRSYRHAEGWFSYDLHAGGAKDLRLRVTFSGSDRRQFDISLNGRVLAEVRLEPTAPGQFVEVDYPIPPAMLPTGPTDKLTVRFEAKPGSMAGGIFDLRLLRGGSD